MRTLLTVALCALLQSVTIAQDPSAENFTRFRAQAIERLNGREGRRLHSNLLKVFGFSDDIRILTGAGIGLPGRRLDLSFTNSEDILLTDARKVPSGTAVTVFHTDFTLTLRAVASGDSVGNAQRIANDEAQSHFREVLLRWDRALPQMLEPSQRK